MKNKCKFIIFFACVFAMQFFAGRATAATELCPGLSADGGIGSASEYSVTATGTSGCNSASGMAEMTLRNTSESAGVVTFKYVTETGEDDVPTYTVTSSVSGTLSLVNGETYTLDIASDERLTFTVTTKKGGYSSKITLTDIKFAVVQLVDIVCLAPGAGGSYTADGSSVTQATKKSVNNSVGLVLIAKPNAGYSFVGWRDGAGALISTSETYTAKNAGTVYPQFVLASTTKAFQVVGGSSYYFWNDAFVAAGSTGTVILASNYTLPTTYAEQGLPGASKYVSGADESLAYIIPSGVKFLVPCKDSDAGMFGAMSKDTYETSEAPTTFRTLTVPSGIEIICNGDLNVNGHRNETGQGKSGTGVPRGGHGKLILQGSGTQLTINGSLYCYGFITGTGVVEVTTGQVYELMQIYDWPGGTNLAGSLTDFGNGGWLGAANKDSKNTLFFSSRYFIQNIEATLIAHSGSTMNMEAVITAAKQTVTSSCELVGSEGLFQLGEGVYITRTYDSATDRITYASGGEGQVTIGSISISASGKSITSSDYILPINGAMTIRVGRGTTAKIDYNFAILPGAAMIVEQGGTLEASGSLFIFDKADMTSAMSFEAQIAPLYTAGRGTTTALKIEHSGRLEVNGTLDIKSSGGLYTTTAAGGTASSNTDKKIYGFGKIIHNGSTSGKTIKAGFNQNLISITASNALGLIEGSSVNETDLKAFGNNTYYGTGEFGKHYWYVPSLPVHSTAVREDDGFTIDAEYRLQDYLWLNAVCYLGEKTSPIDLSAGSVKVYTLNPDGSVCVNSYANGEFTENEGVQILAVNGAIYLIKKIPADEIPDDITFRIEYTDANNGLYRSSQFTVCLEDCKTDDESDTTTNPLVDALLAYGEAAKRYFVTGGAPDVKLNPESIKDSLKESTAFDKTEDASGSYNKGGTQVTLTTKGANVLFEERLSLMFGFQFSVKNMTEEEILQVGVLVGPSTLTSGMTVGDENITAYILYNRGGFTGTGTNMPDLSDGANYKVNDKASVAWDKLNAGGRMVLYMDLLSVDYTSAIEFRPYAVTKDGTVIYGQQYAYGLADYINNMLYLSDEKLQDAIGSNKDVDAFRNLLITTWNYALKAEARFATTN